jgi:hypothetical protein
LVLIDELQRSSNVGCRLWTGNNWHPTACATSRRRCNIARLAWLRLDPNRIAVLMIGGMISSTLLTLIVIPAIFGLVKGFRLSPAGKPQPPVKTKPTVTKLRLEEPAERGEP